jgi:hypothetical protein
MAETERSKYRIGVSSGIYSVARPEELATTVRKLGYSLTRGTSVVELAADVPNEVTQTEGKEIRYIARKQGMDILFHGSLTVPMSMPERAEWRDAHDHICKSIRSAVFSGAKYVNFHACLNIWLELLTYAGRKLTMVFCDHEGRFVSHILAENGDLREWFTNKRWSDYVHDILTAEERTEAISAAESLIEERIRETLENLAKRGLPPEEFTKERERIVNEESKNRAKLERDKIKDAIRNKLASRGRWDSEELRAVVGVIDGYHLMARYLFYTKDPIFTEMAKIYKKLMDKYDLNYSNKNWVDEAWDNAEQNNDRRFKEFFYGMVASKYLEGHVKKALEWINKEFIPEELANLKVDDEKEREEIIKIAKNIAIAIEVPDARDPTHAGLHLLWNPRQLYVAVKTIRKVLDTERVWMLMDYEHVATQGIDPIKDMDEVVNIAPDFGRYTISIHANAPNPLQPHIPIELGDIRIYQLLWYLKQTGFGKHNSVYLIYERGGGEDPFKKSIDSLRTMVKYLDMDVEPRKLPLEFYGLEPLTAGGADRQRQIVFDHAYEPLKDLLEMPEEDWTMLSQSAIRKGKKPEQWKKGEFK